MVSLATGSVNFAKQVYENSLDLVEGMTKTMLEYRIKPEIEIFDLAMLYTTECMVKAWLIAPPPHGQVVLGIPNALPARRRVLEFKVSRSLRAAAGGLSGPPPSSFVISSRWRAGRSSWAVTRGPGWRTALRQDATCRKQRRARGTGSGSLLA